MMITVEKVYGFSTEVEVPDDADLESDSVVGRIIEIAEEQIEAMSDKSFISKLETVTTEAFTEDGNMLFTADE